MLQYNLGGGWKSGAVLGGWLRSAVWFLNYGEESMHMLLVKFHSGLTEDVVRRNLEERLPLFRAVRGLKQKYYAREPSSGDYVGIYLFESEAALNDYRGSELAKSIPPVYQIEGASRVEVVELLFPLHEEPDARTP